MLLAFATLVLLESVPAFAGDEINRTLQIKAVFLHKFAVYVEWPAQVFPSATSPIVIGAYCTERFGSLLEDAVRGRIINGRAVAVKLLKTAGEATAVNAVYICAENDALWTPVTRALNGTSVLTVADSEQSGGPSPAIYFVLQGDRVHFNINMVVADRAGLRITDQLLKVAITVKRAP